MLNWIPSIPFTHVETSKKHTKYHSGGTRTWWKLNLRLSKVFCSVLYLNKHLKQRDCNSYLRKEKKNHFRKLKALKSSLVTEDTNQTLQHVTKNWILCILCSDDKKRTCRKTPVGKKWSNKIHQNWWIDYSTPRFPQLQWGFPPDLIAQLLKNAHQSPPLGAKTCAKVPSWDPERTLKCPLGSQNVRHRDLLGAKTYTKVPSWEPKCVLKCPLGNQNVC